MKLVAAASRDYVDLRARTPSELRRRNAGLNAEFFDGIGEAK